LFFSLFIYLFDFQYAKLHYHQTITWQDLDLPIITTQHLRERVCVRERDLHEIGL
jgi:hypothetical protein